MVIEYGKSKRSVRRYAVTENIKSRETKCTYFMFFRWLLTVVIHEQFQPCNTSHTSSTGASGSHERSYRKQGEKKGELQKFTWWWLLFLEADHRLTQQYCPQPFFPTGRDSNSPDFLFQPVPSLFLNSPKMSQNLILSTFRLWLLNVKLQDRFGFLELEK